MHVLTLLPPPPPKKKRKNKYEALIAGKTSAKSFNTLTLTWNLRWNHNCIFIFIPSTLQRKSQQPQQVCIGCSITWDSFISKHGKSFKTNLNWTKSRTSEAWSTYAGRWSISAGKSVVYFHLNAGIYRTEQRWLCCHIIKAARWCISSLNTMPHHRVAPSAENSLKWKNANMLQGVCIYLAICHHSCPWWLWYWRLTWKQCNFWVFWFIQVSSEVYDKIQNEWV